MKVKHVKYEHDGIISMEQWHLFCPGCNSIHALSPKIHQFNGDFDKPTFSPSLLMNHNPEKICHSYVRDGYIQYLDDCFHGSKNQTIELPDLTEELLKM